MCLSFGLGPLSSLLASPRLVFHRRMLTLYYYYFTYSVYLVYFPVMNKTVTITYFSSRLLLWFAWLLNERWCAEGEGGQGKQEVDDVCKWVTESEGFFFSRGGGGGGAGDI